MEDLGCYIQANCVLKTNPVNAYCHSLCEARWDCITAVLYNLEKLSVFEASLANDFLADAELHIFAKVT